MIFLRRGSRRAHRTILAVLLVGHAATAVATTVSRGAEDFAAWPTDILRWDVSPVDLSFLNLAERPAGRHGFLAVRGDRLVFADGTVVRFWGTNLAAYALFGTPSDVVKRQARRLSELGFNLVRFHHHDSAWVDPNVFGSQAAADTRNLSPAMLDKLDWWIKCLKEEGVYVWLDLQVGRQFKSGDDIEGFLELAKGRPTADPRGFNYVNSSIRDAMRRFDDAYVNHFNRYTGLRYKDDPAIAAMLISNENDVTFHFGNALLRDKGVPIHNARYLAESNAFAARHGLSPDKTWRSWEHGPSKLFLNDLEHRFDREMIDYLRSLSVRVPVVTTSSWGYDPLSSLPALTTGDLIDAHSYGGPRELEKDPADSPNMTQWIAAAQVAGKPLTVSEWNVEPFPMPDRHAIPLYVASSARLQGWRAVMQYAYSQEPISAHGTPSNWHAYNDPALMATLPAAALLYRRGHVRESTTTYAFAPTAVQLFDQEISAKTSVALRSAAEKGRLVVLMPRTESLPWLKPGIEPVGAERIVDPQRSLLVPQATEAVSDSRELRHDWKQGTFVIDTPMTQAAMGRIGGRTIHLGDVDITAVTANATVAVQSMDDQPIAASNAILISLGARSIPEGADRLPFHSEPVIAQVAIRAPAGLKLRVSHVTTEKPADRREAKKTDAVASHDDIPVRYDEGRYLIDFGRGPQTYWFVLKR